ncbi:hypothetical protein Bbelb_251740 [Branchiostoma belcheri]|nr:hypothetical protein Bbelb_251740 [Branchiostoma belcheri]
MGYCSLYQALGDGWEEFNLCAAAILYSLADQLPWHVISLFGQFLLFPGFLRFLTKTSSRGRQRPKLQPPEVLGDYDDFEVEKSSPKVGVNWVVPLGQSGVFVRRDVAPASQKRVDAEGTRLQAPSPLSPSCMAAMAPALTEAPAATQPGPRGLKPGADPDTSAELTRLDTKHGPVDELASLDSSPRVNGEPDGDRASLPARTTLPTFVSKELIHRGLSDGTAPSLPVGLKLNSTNSMILKSKPLNTPPIADQKSTICSGPTMSVANSNTSPTQSPLTQTTCNNESGSPTNVSNSQKTENSTSTTNQESSSQHAENSRSDHTEDPVEVKSELDQTVVSTGSSQVGAGDSTPPQPAHRSASLLAQRLLATRTPPFEGQSPGSEGSWRRKLSGEVTDVTGVFRRT